MQPVLVSVQSRTEQYRKIVKMKTFVESSVLVLQLALCVSALKLEDGAPIADTQEGALRGTILKSRIGREFYGFKGVKYGEAAVRFELAKPVKPWTGVRDANTYADRCPGFGVFVQKIHTGSEDCLFLNVFAPSIDGGVKTGLPVLFWIQGGGFMDGYAPEYPPDFIMDHDVILVSIDYRLGLLGFLNTEDGTVPANNGFKDMILALKWVQRNIAAFGGDPEKITLFGHSTGATAIQVFMLSPATKGLFQSAIVLSATALDRRSFKPSPLQDLKNYAKDLKCTSENTRELVDCLRGLDAREIFAPAMKPRPYPTYWFAASMDKVLAGADDYFLLPATPYELLTQYSNNSKDVPFITGITDNEGWIFDAWMLSDPSKLADLDKRWTELSLGLFQYLPDIPKDDVQKVSDKLREIYAEEGQITKNSMMNLFSDLLICRGSRLLTELHAHCGSKVYPYLITYHGGYSISILAGFERNGMTHSDELQFIFPVAPYFDYNVTWPRLEPKSEEEAFSKNLVSIFVSFATDGSVPSEWKPVTMDKLENQNYPVMVLSTKPEVKTDDERYQRIVKADALLSPYDEPQISWRANGSQ